MPAFVPRRPVSTLVPWTTVALAVGLAVTMLVRPPTADAASAAFAESFTGDTLTVPEHWTSSKGGGGTGFNGQFHAGEFACLTALSQTASIPVGTGSIVGCPRDRSQTPTDTSPLDVDRPGVLRLTDNRFAQSAMVLYNQPQKMSDGLDISFRFAMHSGVTCPSVNCGVAVTGADGFAFFIKDGSDIDDSAGTGGGALGYGLAFNRVSNAYTTPGIRAGLLGIGFDFYGAFSSDGTGAGNIVPARSCPGQTLTLAASGGRVFDHVVIRGPDTSPNRDGSCGYAYLGRSDAAVDFGRSQTGVGSGTSAPDRAAAERQARIVIDKPGVGARVKVFVWLPGQPQPETPVLDVPQPDGLAGVETFKFGFSAGTGWATLVHEIWDLNIILADPVIQAVQAAALIQDQDQDQDPIEAEVVAAGPRLTCTPDPVRPGAEVRCTVTSGPADHDILWRARIADRFVASQGLRLNASGSGTFAFRAPSDARGARITVELVAWDVATDVDVVASGPVPVRIDAGDWLSGATTGLRAAGVVALLVLAPVVLRRPRANAPTPVAVDRNRTL